MNVSGFRDKTWSQTLPAVQASDLLKIMSFPQNPRAVQVIVGVDRTRIAHKQFEMVLPSLVRFREHLVFFFRERQCHRSQIRAKTSSSAGRGGP